MITQHKNQNPLSGITADDLLHRIRKQYRNALLFRTALLLVCIICTVAGVLCTLPLLTVLGAAAAFAVLIWMMPSLLRVLKPERCSVFRKYGTPKEIASELQKGSGNVYFENEDTFLTDHFLIDIHAPASFLMLRDITLAYPLKSAPLLKPKGQYFAAHDKAGERFVYPFSVKQKQIFKISIILDKIYNNADRCRILREPSVLLPPDAGCPKNEGANKS